MKSTTPLAIAALAIFATFSAAKPAPDPRISAKPPKIDPATLKPEELPEEMKDLAPEQRKEFIEKRGQERPAIQEEIKTLSKERAAQVADELRKNAESGGKTLDEAMIEATRKQTAKLGYNFSN